MSKKNNLIQGVGINDSDYSTTKHEFWYENGKRKKRVIWYCPYMLRWRNMLERCYSLDKRLGSYISKGCYVCEDWLLFTNFKSWMESQDWFNKELDKDLIVQGSNVYSPETCCFVPDYLNSIFTCEKVGKYPIGVSAQADRLHYKNPYKATIRNGSGKLLQLGSFPNPEQAHKAWQRKKIEIITQQIDRVSSEVTGDVFSKIKSSLLKRIAILHSHIENDQETIKL